MAKIQQGFVKLQKLLQVEPYKVVGLWSNGETRLHGFTDKIEDWKNSSNKELKKLANPKVFKSAFVNNGTLAFAGSTVQVPGVPGPQPVDFDRRVLYNESQLIGKAVTYADAILRQTSRIKRRRQPPTLPVNLQIKSHSRIFEVDSETIKKMSQEKLGTPVTPLIVIGDELIELE